MGVGVQGTGYTGLALCSLKGRRTGRNLDFFSDLVDFCLEILFLMDQGCCILMGRGRGIQRWNLSLILTEGPEVGVQEITGE